MARRHRPNQLSLLRDEPPLLVVTCPNAAEGQGQNFGERFDRSIFPAPPFVAPNRQSPLDECEETGSSLPPYFADAIWIDRRHTDIDGPPHRFTIRLGDTIEAFVSCGCVVCGRVIDICHKRREVRLASDEKDTGDWHPVEHCFPIPPSDDR
jgi:hypothetical protein